METRDGHPSSQLLRLLIDMTQTSYTNSTECSYNSYTITQSPPKNQPVFASRSLDHIKKKGIETMKQVQMNILQC